MRKTSKGRYKPLASAAELCRDHRVNLDAMDYVDTEDPVELQRRLAEWSKTHGLPTHAMLWCAPNTVTTTGDPTTIVVAFGQPVTPCGPADLDDIVAASSALWNRRVTAGRLDLLAYCYVPIICATNRTEDASYLVRARKIGVTQTHTSGSKNVS